MIEGQLAVEHAKVRTYWETGRLIKEHVLLFKPEYFTGTMNLLHTLTHGAAAPPPRWSSETRRGRRVSMKYPG